MKKVAVMQPYLFPYIGYFQLMKAVDEFVAYDDVQWIKGGWINRNRILIDGAPNFITLPVKKGHLSTKISEKEFTDDIEERKREILEVISGNYKRAPYYNQVYALVERSFSYKSMRAGDFIVNSLRECCDYLGVSTKILLSSQFEKTDDLRAQDRLIDINKRIGTGLYINPIGGVELYSREDFKNEGMQLSFIKSKEIIYRQFDDKFEPWLSIIDVMMFNSVGDINRMLDNYELS